MIFSVTFNNGLTCTVNSASSLEDAFRKGEAKINQPFYVAPSRAAAALVAENESLRLGEDGMIYKVNPAVAVSATRMHEIYINGGYCIVPHPEQDPAAAAAA